LGGHFSVARGGAEYQAGCIADKLVSTDEFEVFYLARAIDPEYHPHGYQLVQIKQKTRLNKHAFFFDAIDLHRILKDIQPDIIYQRGLLAYTGVAAFYAKKRNCRLIFHIAAEFDVSPFRKNYPSPSIDPFKWIDKKAGEYGILYANAIIAQTQRQSNLLKNHYGRDTTAVIGNFHPLPTEKMDKANPVKVIWVANFKPNKRPEIFVRLAKDFQHLDEAKFIMMGDPGGEGKYSELHKEIQKLKNMEFLGSQPLEKVNKLLAQGHIFVNTSIQEGFPNTFIQAWMRQVPVVSLNVDIDGLLARNTIGFLSGSYDKLKKDVECLLMDPDLRNKMGLQAYKYAVANHSPDIFKKILRIIKEQ